MRYIEVGVVVLFVAFVLTLFPFSDEPIRLVVLLEANPERIFYYVYNSFFFSILPLATSLAFIFMGLRQEKLHSTGTLTQWSFAVIGGISAGWGILQLPLIFNAYNSSARFLNSFTPAGVSMHGLESSVVLVYAMDLLASLLWLFIGALLIYSYLASYRKKVQALNCS